MASDRVDKADRIAELQTSGLAICGTNDWRFDDMKRFAMSDDRWLFVPVEGMDHLQTWLDPSSVLPPLTEFLKTLGAAG